MENLYVCSSILPLFDVRHNRTVVQTKKETKTVKTCSFTKTKIEKNIKTNFVGQFPLVYKLRKLRTYANFLRPIPQCSNKKIILNWNHYKQIRARVDALGEPDGGTASIFQSISSINFFPSL